MEIEIELGQLAKCYKEVSETFERWSQIAKNTRNDMQLAVDRLNNFEKEVNGLKHVFGSMEKVLNNSIKQEEMK